MVRKNHSHLLHCLPYGLEGGGDMYSVLYAPHAYADWRNAYAIHTVERWRSDVLYDPLPPSVEFSETNIRDLNNAFGEMSRSVLFGTSDFVLPDVPILSVAELTARKDRGEDLTHVQSTVGELEGVLAISSQVIRGPPLSALVSCARGGL
ncbi:hypothetical protein HPB48_017249 [Haemaphysalis longicornis]|uniref:Uncharacterized protein n=1 Tax=Haemaphysalis longicornis TaxID=44386 RepID=A0A9J6H4Q6_HAELO|nr:hypothetical protein HPB48_017249 [Haemaphysalis longicornis]